jgi:hypothetical protein
MEFRIERWNRCWFYILKSEGEKGNLFERNKRKNGWKKKGKCKWIGLNLMKG